MKWIKCNLPWTFYGDWDDCPKMPRLQKEIQAEFGTTPDKEYAALNKMLKGARYCTPKYEEIIKTKEYKAAQRKYKKFNQKVGEWTKTHPLWVEYQTKLKEYDEVLKQKSFCGRNLNKPGTLVEIMDKELKQYLIGDINSLGGVCDDCMGFGKDAVVVRYKIMGDW